MQNFSIAAVVQQGRLGYEALLLAASLRRSDPGFSGRLLLLEPQPGPFWPETDPRLPEGPLRARLLELGAEILPFENRVFGAAYPHGNKIEALAALPPGPFLFLDSDTLITGPLSQTGFDFTRPSASMRREGTWPQPELYGPGYTAIWKALYDRFGLDFAASLDPSWPDEYWQHYLYFNAGWFFGADAPAFGRVYLEYAASIYHDPPPELICQELLPWLDQITLPLVISAFGGGRPGPALAGLDGATSCHYRSLPLLYARESDAVVALLEEIALEKANRRLLRDWPQARQMIYLKRGVKARALFDRVALPKREKIIRNTLRRSGLWLR
ncbi:hypothetical protein [Pseudogemmobacter faecipullorum]|uniref:Uncharacterized protein n=1 Tax=Pseudogemmobacter faecipullorum TaxID=2755041 RepID=A0ABS8CKP8_9RHOB|nr:hypothetical protein [Pseudogemmobacter faecipullorum]MCB5409931.1 hypothetical protein [Pseudogemmobacter faecipullorum]